MEGKMDMNFSTQDDKLSIMTERLDEMETRVALEAMMDVKIAELRDALKSNIDDNK